MPIRQPASGFTLIELLVVIAIIGVLAAIGVPMFNGYVDGARKTAAQNGLRSIYMMEKDWFSTNGAYFSGATTDIINANLFTGEKTLDGQYYDYDIQTTATSFTARAVKRSDRAVIFTLDQSNKTTGF